MILEIIIAGFFITTVLNIILNKFEMPTIIAYIFTGVAITYIFGINNNITSNEFIQIVAELGIAFLLFTIGLEFSIKHLKKMKKDVFIIGGLQVFVTSIAIFCLLFFILGFDKLTSLLIGLGLSLSSTAIVLKMLSESGDINKEYGKKAVGILIFQDLAVVPILILITIISSNVSNIYVLIGETLLSAILLFFILFIVGKYILNFFLNKVIETKSNEIFIASILFIVIFSSWFAHYMGFTYSLGAFIAGLMIAETHFKYKVEADLIPFRDILLGFFFVTIGIQLNFSVIFDNIFIIFSGLFLFILVKIFITFGIVSIFSNKKTALLTALSVFQFGEFGLIIFGLAFSNGLIDFNTSQILTVIIIFSMIITPFVLKKLDYIDFLEKKKKNSKKDLKKEKFDVILIGYGRVGKQVSKILDKNKIKTLIVDNNIKAFNRGIKDGKNIILGEAYSERFLKSIGINKVKNIVISVGENEKLYLVASVIKKMNIDGNIIIKVHSFDEKLLLKKLNIKNIIVETEKTAIAIFEKINLKI